MGKCDECGFEMIAKHLEVFLPTPVPKQNEKKTPQKKW
jgi:hypothetical protein